MLHYGSMSAPHSLGMGYTISVLLLLARHRWVEVCVCVQQRRHLISKCYSSVCPVLDFPLALEMRKLCTY